MRNFFYKYPEFEHRPLYIAGESYAGHYIPAIANYLHHSPDWRLNKPAGIMIGNGWVDPFYQYSSYPDFAYEENLISS